MVTHRAGRIIFSREETGIQPHYKGCEKRFAVFSGPAPFGFGNWARIAGQRCAPALE